LAHDAFRATHPLREFRIGEFIDDAANDSGTLVVGQVIRRPRGELAVKSVDARQGLVVQRQRPNAQPQTYRVVHASAFQARRQQVGRDPEQPGAGVAERRTDAMPALGLSQTSPR
jgi:hypothetical protein